MKLLFVIDEVDQLDGATQLLTKRLCQELAGKGHLVDLLILVGAEKKSMDPAGVRVYRRECLAEEKLHCFVAQRKAKGQSKPRIAFGLLFRPTALMTAIQLLVFKKGPREKFCQKQIEQLCRLEKYEAVLSASAPHHTAFALAAAQIGQTVKAPILFDPYSTGAFYNTFRDIRKEKRLLEASDLVFVTDLMLRDYQNSSLVPWLDKMRVLQFPGLVNNLSEAYPCRSETEKIRCVFCGNLYPEIREPYYLFELFAAMQAPEIQLVMIGGGLDHLDSNEIARWRRTLEERLVFMGTVSSRQAFSEMSRADILVNIGNRNNNQLPSKVFDYIGTGRPILHLAEIKEDTSTSYFNKYPLSLVLLRDSFSVQEQARKALDFCRENAGRQIGFEQIEKHFSAFTPCAVADQLIQMLGEAIHNENK